MPDGAVRAADGRGEPGPGGELARRAEPGDVADLGQDDQRGEGADAGQLREDLDPRVGPGMLADFGIEPVDPAPAARRSAPGRPRSPPGTPLAVPATRASLGRARSNTRPPGPDRDQPGPRGSCSAAGFAAAPAERGAAVAPGAGVPRAARSTPPAAGPRAAAAPGSRHRPCLQPRRGDRLALQRVHQVRVEAVILQQLQLPTPAERRLERRRRPRRQAADHAQDRLDPVTRAPRVTAALFGIADADPER